MKLHPEVEASVEFEQARESLAARQTLAALAHLEKALKLQDNPSWYSYLGYCIAKQRGQTKKGIDLCPISLELTGRAGPLPQPGEYPSCLRK